MGFRLAGLGLISDSGTPFTSCSRLSSLERKTSTCSRHLTTQHSAKQPFAQTFAMVGTKHTALTIWWQGSWVAEFNSVGCGAQSLWQRIRFSKHWDRASSSSPNSRPHNHATQGQKLMPTKTYGPPKPPKKISTPPPPIPPQKNKEGPLSVASQ